MPSMNITSSKTNRRIMSMYICGHCQAWRDDDYSGAYEHPENDTKMVCDDCYLFLDEVEDKRTFAQKMRYWLHCKTYKARLRISRALGRTSDPLPY